MIIHVALSFFRYRAGKHTHTELAAMNTIPPATPVGVGNYHNNQTNTTRLVFALFAHTKHLLSCRTLFWKGRIILLFWG